MSDEPSDAQKIIAGVTLSAIKKQAYVLIEDDGRVLVGGALDLNRLAAEVDKALGGLTPRYAASYEKYPQLPVEKTISSTPDAAEKWLSLGEPRWLKVFGWVSGWTVTE